MADTNEAALAQQERSNRAAAERISENKAFFGV